MIVATHNFANVLSGCMLCWSPLLPHWFPPPPVQIDVLDRLKEPMGSFAPPTPPQQQRRPTTSQPKAKRRTIVIPGYVPPYPVPRYWHHKGGNSYDGL